MERLAITEFAPAKINLALHVLGRRDGFHEIDSIVAFANIGDELRFEPAAEFALTVSGPFAHLLPPVQSNIISAAWKAVTGIAAARGLHLPPVAVHLTKNLPVAAGMGGGSADAAAAMRRFLRLAGIEPMDGDISKAALALGADVPVCLWSRACRMQGIGERLTPLDFRPLHAVLVNPLIAVRTQDVFREFGRAAGGAHGLKFSDLSDASTWRNDLSAAAVVLVPAIAEALAALQKQRCLRFARMSGSGATCFGVFEDGEAARRAVEKLRATFPEWWVRQTILG